MGSRSSTSRAIVLLLTFGWLAASGTLPAQQQPVFRTGVDVIVMDVNVVDRSARPVQDLAPTDFTVMVDGKPRNIVSATYVHHGMRAVVPSPRGRGSDSGLAVFDRLAEPTSQPGRNVLLVVDEDSLDVQQGLLATNKAREFLNQLPAADRVGVVAIPRVSGSVVFSADRADALKALDKVITAVPETFTNHWIGLQEAFDIEGRDTNATRTMIHRECACDYTGDNPSEPVTKPCSSDPAMMMCVNEALMDAHNIVLAEKLHAQRSLDALRSLAETLAGIPGPKTLVLISGGIGPPETTTAFSPLEPATASGQINLYTLYLERSLFGQGQRRLPVAPEREEQMMIFGLENVTSAAGGTFIQVTGTLEGAFDRVATEMSGSYELGIEVTPEDRDGKPHSVQVKVKRTGLEVRSRKRYVIEPDKRAGAQPGSAPSATVAAPVPPRPWRTQPPADAKALDMPMLSAELMATLTRAAEYVEGWQAEVTALAADEDYQQVVYTWKSASTIVNGVSTATEDWFVNSRRDTRADYVLLRAAGPGGWQHFRDVFQVDGRNIHPPASRLQQAFEGSLADGTARAQQIMNESVRYNIGFGQRNMNVPPLAMTFLERANRGRFSFKKDGEVPVEDTLAWRIAFVESARPTFFSLPEAGSMPVRGTVWLDPQTGLVLKTAMQFEMPSADVELVVTYGAVAELDGIYVPTEMHETYTTAGTKLECVARYRNFRRLKVGRN